MRRTHQCARCQKTTAHHSDVCVACGGQLMGFASWYSRYSSPTFLLLLGFLIALSVLGVLYADTYLPALSDWYLEMAVPPELVS